jgi:hypothetical protein
VFADAVEDPAIKIQLLLGGEKMVNEALRQTVELQAMLLDARPIKTSSRTFLGELIAPNQAKRSKTIDLLELWGARPLSGNCPYRRKAENDRCGKRDKRHPRDTQEPARRSECDRDILHAYDAFVNLGLQMLRLAGEEVSLWSPGAGPGLPAWWWPMIR